MSSLCVHWQEDGGSVHSRQKAVNEARVLSEVSVDLCRMGTNEVECC